MTYKEIFFITILLIFSFLFLFFVMFPILFIITPFVLKFCSWFNQFLSNYWDFFINI